MASALVFLKYGYDRVGGFEPFGPKQSIATWTSLAGFCVAGFLVGFGTKLANGCTSGHGLCGLPRFSLRSFVAVCTFLTTAIGVSTYDYYFGLGPIAGSVFNGIYLTNDHNITAKVTLALGAILPVIGFAVSSKKNVVDQAITFTVGALFSLGLMVSGMSRRTNILQFLQINQSWNPALLFVLGCGLLVNLVTFTYMRKRQDSLCGGKVFDPKGGVIDWQLVVGAACFGAGWGIAGICPGPFLVLSSVSTVPIQVYFGVSMIGGMFAARFVAQVIVG